MTEIADSTDSARTYDRTIVRLHEGRNEGRKEGTKEGTNEQKNERTNKRTNLILGVAVCVKVQVGNGMTQLQDSAGVVAADDTPHALRAQLCEF